MDHAKSMEEIKGAIGQPIQAPPFKPCDVGCIQPDSCQITGCRKEAMRRWEASEAAAKLKESRPAHYPGWEVGDFITRLGLGFYEGCVIKYVARYKKKGGVEDLKKARDYLERLIQEQTK